MNLVANELVLKYRYLTVNGEKNYPVLRNSVLSKIIKDAISSASIRFADGMCKNLIFDFYC